jgi:DNA-binding MarR family transcriptional regulator
MDETATRPAVDRFEAPPEGRELTEYAGYLLHLAARLREKVLDDGLAPLGLNATRFRVLSIVQRLRLCTMGELSMFSTVDRTTMTRLVDQLTEQGLVERHTPPDDRRKVTLKLTPAGGRLYKRALSMIQKVNHAVFIGIADEQLQRMTDVLRTVLGSVIDDPKTLEMLLTFSRAEEG